MFFNVEAYFPLERGCVWVQKTDILTVRSLTFWENTYFARMRYRFESCRVHNIIRYRVWCNGNIIVLGTVAVGSSPTTLIGVLELVDRLVLGTSAFKRVGSSPSTDKPFV